MAVWVYVDLTSRPVVVTLFYCPVGSCPGSVPAPRTCPQMSHSSCHVREKAEPAWFWSQLRLFGCCSSGQNVETRVQTMCSSCVMLTEPVLKEMQPGGPKRRTDVFQVAREAVSVTVFLVSLQLDMSLCCSVASSPSCNTPQ